MYINVAFHHGLHCMGESFQDYSRIQDFEADFPKKVSLKTLNSADYYRFLNLYSVCLKAAYSVTLNILRKFLFSF